MAYCSRCKLDKSSDRFGRLKSGREGLSFYCLECRWEINRLPHNKEMKRLYDSSPARKASIRRYLASEQHRQKQASGYYAANKRKNSRNAIQRLRYGKDVATRRQIEFDLPLDYYTRLIKQPCYYCGQVTFGVEAGGGLDRIDNEKGYIIGNVVQSCGECNMHRHIGWTVEETKIAVAAIMCHRGEKLCLMK